MTPGKTIISGAVCLIGLLVFSRFVFAMDDPRDVRVALVTLPQSEDVAKCIGTKFLGLIELETDIKTAGELTRIGIDSDEIFGHPFTILTGDGAFELTDEQAARLGRYASRGGFLLISASCSNSAFNASMQRTLARAFPGRELEPVPLEHELFRTLFDVRSIRSKRPRETPVFRGLEIEGRLAVLYSPAGLNDTQNAAPGCCCCGSNEILNASFINANALVYALTH